MALTMPIFIVLVAYFAALMVEVQARATVVAATSLAAQASLAAPVNDAKASCDFALESFWVTLYDVPHGGPGSATPALGSCVGATSGNADNFAPGVPGKPATSHSVVQLVSGGPNPVDSATGFGCDGSQNNLPSGVTKVVGATAGGAPTGNSAVYYNGNFYPVYLGVGDTGPPVVCSASAEILFANTAVGFAVKWTPTFEVTSVATPSAVRQCDPGKVCG
jgi:hypothetical protein